MKILFLIRSLQFGGAERQLVTLAKGLHQKGLNVGVTVFYPGGPLQAELHEVGIQVIVLEKRGRWDLVGFFMKLIQTIRAFQPDILHGYLGVPNILTVLLKPIFPKVKMVWGVRASFMDLEKYDWLIKTLYKIECKLSRFADLIIANSYAGMEYSIKQGFPAQKMIVVPNGINMEQFGLDLESKNQMRRVWGISEDETLIGMVGRLDPMKDHSTFLKAATLLVKEITNVRFVCVGEGPLDYKRQLQEEAETLGLSKHLLWIGNVNDMSAVYNALDILTLSSYGEGFPNVIGEAMACGVPCVVTEVGDSARIVGDTGVVVPPKSPDQLAEGLKAMLNRLDGNRADISRKVRERIVSEFSSEILFQRTVEALRRLL
ncbi:glycosyltransferase [Effusibacillus lacus]|uniref:Group 1 glycosyl transferase n=1 Tax=Effusibacillus lacus TaxID=1348429 RepID=A0A292YU84_9BACL|nr:glycosyltransferase [Effusibacillus lacus]TCS73726.1 glycosyltransferase involved in cell wall biosynthesis [Effusibacillus lacus]GAX92060.1 group 1 glycosyl transferase [Effusibacillus lacus]